METNVIYNKDCYKGIKKIPSKSIDLVYIDIPYDIAKNESGGLLSNRFEQCMPYMRCPRCNKPTMKEDKSE